MDKDIKKIDPQTAISRQMYQMFDKNLDAIAKTVGEAIKTNRKVTFEGAECTIIQGKDGKNPTQEEVLKAIQPYVPEIKRQIEESLKSLVIHGKDGDKGDTGAPGKDGKSIKGDQGIPGKDGDKGDTGAPGKDGLDSPYQSIESIAQALASIERPWLPIEKIIGDIAPRIIRQFGGGNGSGTGGSNVTLKTNGTNNGSQEILNLIAGANVTISDDGVGGITVAVTGGGIPGGVNNELQYNNNGAFGGMVGIKYDEINGSVVLDNALNPNAILQTSAGAGVRKGITVSVGQSTDNNGADMLIEAGEGFTKGGDLNLLAGNTQSGNAGNVLMRAGTGGSSGRVKIQSNDVIRMTDITETVGLEIPVGGMDTLYGLMPVDGNDGDFIMTEGNGNLTFRDAKAFYQYIGSMRGYDTVFTYDGNGNVATKVFGDISVTLTYTYFLNGNLEMIESNTPAFTKTFVYDVNGNVTNINYT